MSWYEFISCINYYTRILNSAKSCISHIFIKNINTSKTKSYDSFNTKVSELNLSISSFKIKNKKIKKLEEWITRGLITSIKQRENMAAKLGNRSFDRELKTKYIKYKNLLNILIKKNENNSLSYYDF